MRNFRWVLLRGLGREHRHWHDFVPKLDLAFAGHLSLDLPGAGKNLANEAPTSIAGHVEFLRERFLREKTQGDWGLLGISLGGMIALEWASRYPEDFKRLVVINASSRDSGYMLERLSPFGIYQITRAGARKDSILRETEIMKMVSNVHTNNQQLIEKFVQIRESAPVSVLTLTKQLWAAARFMLPENIKVPTLVLASLKDNMVNVRCSKGIASALKAKIKIHPTAGHELTLDDPDWCVRQMVEDFDRN